MLKSDSPLGKRIAMVVIATMMTVGVKAVPGDEPPLPKLVVGIMVDDLQEEYIDLLRQHFSRGGFNRLVENSLVFPTVDFGTDLDPTAATAMIYTGASPALNGIPSSEIFDRKELVSKNVFLDREYLGNFTEQTLSPKALLTSNITDEVRIAGDGVTLAYSFASDPGQSLAMGGHAANCAMWINDANGHWATTTFYSDVAPTFNTRNKIRPLSTRLDSVVWAPLLSSVYYESLPAHITRNPFNYTFSKKGPQSMQAFKNTPLVNTEITNMAIDHISQMNLGWHDGPDIINISYTLEPYAFSRNADNRYETIDAYYRLDRDLERLFNAIDKQIGLHNAMIFLATPPQSQRSRRDDKKWNIPYGEFSTRRAMSLLNLYFVSIYGQGNWVTGFHNNDFYLNHDYIKERGLDLSDLRQQAAAFLIQMSGVGSAYSLDDIINNRVGLHASQLKNNTDIRHAGDVKIRVLPGWELFDDFNFPTVKPNQVAREAPPTGILYIMAPGLSHKRLNHPVNARSIAPTICRQLRIRSPNAATYPPIDLYE